MVYFRSLNFWKEQKREIHYGITDNPPERLVLARVAGYIPHGKHISNNFELLMYCKLPQIWADTKTKQKQGGSS